MTEDGDQKSGHPLAPLDLSEEVLRRDNSGTPAALLEMARRADNLMLLDEVAEEEILFEYPMGDVWRQQTGFSRFIRLRAPADKGYALVGRIEPGGG